MSVRASSSVLELQHNPFFPPAGCWINTPKPLSLFTIYQLKNNAKLNQLFVFLSNKEK